MQVAVLSNLTFLSTTDIANRYLDFVFSCGDETITSSLTASSSLVKLFDTIELPVAEMPSTVTVTVNVNQVLLGNGSYELTESTGAIKVPINSHVVKTLKVGHIAGELSYKTIEIPVVPEQPVVSEQPKEEVPVDSVDSVPATSSPSEPVPSQSEPISEPIVSEQSSEETEKKPTGIIEEAPINFKERINLFESKPIYEISGNIHKKVSYNDEEQAKIASRMNEIRQHSELSEKLKGEALAKAAEEEKQKLEALNPISEQETTNTTTKDTTQYNMKTNDVSIPIDENTTEITLNEPLLKEVKPCCTKKSLTIWVILLAILNVVSIALIVYLFFYH